MGRYPFIILCLLGGAKETDLIYEGIATPMIFKGFRALIQ